MKRTAIFIAAILTISVLFCSTAPPSGAAVLSFTGTVTDQVTTLPIAGIQVDLFAPNGAFWATTTTDVNGQWFIYDQGYRKYTLKFSDPGAVYVTEWWNNKPTQAQATSIPYGGVTITANAALL